ncbi:hypothetical protein HK101_011333 [Irineochytrium annulatum]|nr:hypothetical protein HK101_011333 [Irineochytrium annulatum]
MRLSAITVSEDPSALEAAGFGRAADEMVRIGDVLVTFERAGASPPGIVSWTFERDDGSDVATTIHGLPTRIVRRRPDWPSSLNANGAQRLDHLVVMTPDLGAAISHLEAAPLNLTLKRRMERGPARFAFFRAGSVIIEVVQIGEAGPGDASFWGFTVEVVDLAATTAFLGVGNYSGPRRAYQGKNKEIITLRHKLFGLGTNIAFISKAAENARL